MNFITLLCA